MHVNSDGCLMAEGTRSKREGLLTFDCMVTIAHIVGRKMRIADPMGPGFRRGASELGVYVKGMRSCRLGRNACDHNKHQRPKKPVRRKTAPCTG